MNNTHRTQTDFCCWKNQLYISLLLIIPLSSSSSQLIVRSVYLAQLTARTTTQYTIEKTDAVHPFADESEINMYYYYGTQSSSSSSYGFCAIFVTRDGFVK